MAKFNLEEYLKKSLAGVTVEVLEEVKDEEGKAYSYKFVGKTKTLRLKRECFEPADVKVGEAFVNLLYNTPKSVKDKAKKTLDDFINREGKYKKLADKENIQFIKDNLKGLSSFQLETVAYLIDAIKNGGGNDLADMVSEEIMNYDM